ncbi:MAG: YbaN family protein [Candidatus Hydrogenedentes bacterium]|nr:YbaN family protein [Candidatus Hydrogenedentota bacterium]
MYVILGYISLALGIIGMPLPILPTVPFVLLAAYFFSKGSPRLHHWLVSHPYLGKMISDWERNGVISMRAKLLSTAMMVVLFSITLIFVEVSFVIKAIVSMIGVSVLFFIWTRPSERKAREDISSAKDLTYPNR